MPKSQKPRGATIALAVSGAPVSSAAGWACTLLVVCPSASPGATMCATPAGTAIIKSESQDFELTSAEFPLILMHN